MSVITTSQIDCPACGRAVPFQVVQSLNADRRPDLRVEIMDGSLQLQECPHCEKSFRLEPDLNYIDMGRGQWIATFPVSEMAHWNAAEQRAQETFDAAFGVNAPGPAREVGESLSVRVTFGWSALREKLLVDDLELDDVTLELTKIALVRSLPASPLTNGTELRLVDLDGVDFVMAWVRASDETVVETLSVPQAAYYQIEGSEDWEALRAELSSGLFVDAQRLMVESA